jgi:hypothetical protein
MLDLKGESVGSFPVKLPSPAQTGCLLTDLASATKQRIYIACDNGLIYAYELNGKPVSEWLFNKFISVSNEPLLSFRSGDMNRLAFRDKNGKLYFADDRGRVTPSKLELNSDYALNILTDSSENTLVGVNHSGQLVRFDLKDILNSALPADTIKDVSILHTSGGSTVITVSGDSIFSFDNQLKNQGIYTAPAGNYKLMNFTSGTNSYCALTDNTRQIFYLLQPEGKIDERYSSKGCTSFSVIPAVKENDKNKLLIGDNESGIYLYVY